MSFEKSYYVYILTNATNKVIYIGVTNNLIRRIFEHKNRYQKSFTKKYNCNKLIYYEVYFDINIAIRREKQLKGWKRVRKEALINEINPLWKDLILEFE